MYKLKRRVVGLLVVWAALAAAKKPPAATEPARKDAAYARVKEVIRKPGEGPVVVIDRGSEYSIVVGVKGDLWDRARNGLGAFLGTVEVSEVNDGEARLVLPKGSHVPPSQIAVDQIVGIPVTLPATQYRGALTELTLLGAAFLDNSRQPFVADRDIVLATDDSVEKKAFAGMAEALREVIPFTSTFKTPVSRGRYKGKLMADILAVAGPEDLKLFLRFVAAFPSKYMATRWKVSEVFATWILNDAPLSLADEIEDLLVRGGAVDSEVKALRAAFAAVHIPEDNWEVDKDPKAKALLALLEKLAVAHAKQPELAGHLDELRGRLWRRASPTKIVTKKGGKTSERSVSHGADAARAYTSAARRYAVGNLLYASQDAWVAAIRDWNDLYQYDDVLKAYDEAYAALRKGVEGAETSLVAAVLNIAVNYLREGAEILIRRGKYDRVIEDLAPLAALYKTTVSSVSSDLHLDVLDLMARADRKLGKKDEAQKLYDALTLSTKDAPGQVKLAFEIGDTWFEARDYVKAGAAYLKGADLARKAKLYSEVARCLAASGQAEWNLGHLKDALARHDEAMKLREEIGDRSGIAWQLKQVAKIRKEMGDRDAAREQLERAMGIYKELGDRSAQAAVGMDLAEMSCDLNDAVRCQKAYEEAKALYHDLGFRPDEARALLGLGRALAVRHDFDGATKTVREAATLHEQLKDIANLANDLEWLGRLQWASNDRAGAHVTLERVVKLDQGMRFSALIALAWNAQTEGHLDEVDARAKDAAETLAKSPSPEWQARLGELRGSIAEGRGRYDEALAAREEVAALAEKTGNRVMLANAVQARAWTLCKIGRLAEAKVAAQKAAAIAKENGDPSQQAWAMNALAEVASQYGDQREQLRLYDEALALMRKAGDTYGEAALRFNRSLVLVDLRDLDGALAENAKSYEMSRANSSEDLEVGLLSSRGQILGLQKKYPEAEKLLGEALAQARRTTPDRVPSLIVNLAKIQAKRGDYPRALATLDEAVKIEAAQAGKQYGALAELGKTQALAGDDAKAETTLRDAIARAESRGGAMPWEPLYYLGLVHSRGGHTDEALTALERAVKEIERSEVVLENDRARAQYRADKVDCYHLLIKLLLAKGRVEDGLRYLEQAKTGELNDVARRGGESDPQAAFAVELEAQEQRVQSMVDGERNKEKSDPDKMKRLDELLDGIHRRRAEFVDKVERENPRLFDRFAVRPLELEKLQKFIPDGMLLVSPVTLDDRIVIFAVTNKSVMHVESLVKSAEVEQLVGTILDEMDPRKLAKDDATLAEIERSVAASLARIEKPSRRLYDLLLRPVFASVGMPKVLAVSASGTLRYLPFAALHDGERWMVERVPVVNVSALGSYELTTKPSSKKELTVLALADPDGTLPAARGEVEAIRTVLVNAVVVSGKDASQERLRSEIRRTPPDIVHLATHGFLDATNPERSRILLAGRELSYPDIPTLDLGHSRLVVLSACETAQRARGSGVEIASLASQFERARVSSVLATLWPVNDQATADLMKSFYGGMKGGASLASSLADAQRSLMTSKEHPSWRHPAFWAPFVLMGSP